MTKNTQLWLHGLIAAFVGGGASAVTGGITVGSIAPAQFNFGPQLASMGKLMLALFLVNGALAAFAYLSKSPLPNPDAVVTETKVEQVETKTTASVTKTEPQPPAANG